MINLTVLIDDDILVAYQELFRDLPRLSQRAFRGEIERLSKPMLAELQRDPGPVVYANEGKLRWKSERQRKAFFASDGFGSGIPYVRTGGLSAAWEVDITGTGVDLDVHVINDNPAARYVQGDDQQPFHSDTGWPDAALIFVRYEELVGDALIDTWFSIVEFNVK
jgi:hypothetical protein